MKVFARSIKALMAVMVVMALVISAAPVSAEETWESKNDMPFETHTFSTAQLPDGRVFFYGGVKPNSGPSEETWLYDPATDEWEARAPSPLATAGSSAVYMPDGRVYVLCGMDHNNQWSHGVMAYDIAGDSWEQLPGDPDLGFFREAVALDPNRILIAGGFAAAPLIAVADCMIYDIRFKAFADAEPLPYTVGLGSMVRAGDSIYYIGGIEPHEPVLYYDILRYDIAVGQWSHHAKMSEPRFWDSEVLAGDGLVYLYGQGLDPQYVPSVRALDLRDGSFKECPVPNKHKYGGIAATDDGRVIIFGGEYENVVSREVLSLRLFEKETWLGTTEAGPGRAVRVYATVSAQASETEDMTATAYLVRDGIVYGRYELVGLGNGTASALMTLPEDLAAGEYEVIVTDVDLGFGMAGSISFAPLALTVNDLPSPADRIGELEDQLNETQGELAELKDSLDGKMDAMVGYALVALVLATLAVSVVILVRKK